MRFLFYWLGSSLLMGSMSYFHRVDAWDWQPDVAWRCGVAAILITSMMLWAVRQERQVALLPAVQRYAARHRYRFWVGLRWFMVLLGGPLTLWLPNGVAEWVDLWPVILLGIIWGGANAESDWRKLDAERKEHT